MFYQVAGLVALLLLVGGGAAYAQLPARTTSAPGGAAPARAQYGSVMATTSLHNDTSPAFRDLARTVVPLGPTMNEEREQQLSGPGLPGYSKKVLDPLAKLVGAISGLLVPSTTQNFEGVADINLNAPPDANGDVGLNYYIQTTNAGFGIFSKAGAVLVPATPISTLFAGFGGPCATRNDGDPIGLYDQAADRYFVSQFAVPGGSQGYHECIAVSVTGDPTGAYHRYDFLISQTLFNDYPHCGVWTDA